MMMGNHRLRGVERTLLVTIGIAIGLLLGQFMQGAIDTPDMVGESAPVEPPPRAAAEPPIDSGDSIARSAGLDAAQVIIQAEHAGGPAICTLGVDGRARCAGEDGWGELSPPTDVQFTDLHIGYETSCGVDRDGVLRCWGREDATFEISGGFAATVINQGAMVCALSNDGRVECFDRTNPDWTAQEWRLDLPRVVRAFASPNGIVCGVTDAGAAACASAYHSSEPPFSGFDAPNGVPLTHVAVGWESACSLDESGEAYCWGRGGPITREIPTGPFVDVSVNAANACALTGEGSTICWGAVGGEVSPDGLVLRSVVLDSTYTNLVCGVTDDRQVACWPFTADGPVDDGITGQLQDLMTRL